MTANPITDFLLGTAAIILVCHSLGAVAAHCRQPRVIGEILGGLLLGPLALGLIWPGAETALFPTSVQASLDLAAQLGLVIFVFLLGCELRTNDLKGNRGVLSVVVVGSMGIPFLGGVAVAALGLPLIIGSAGNRTLTVLFMGLALAVTALPVMARLLVDLGLEQSRAGVLSLAAGACGDGLLWVALTVLLGASGLHGIEPGLTTAMALGLLAVTVLVVRPVLRYFVGRADRTSRGEQLLAPLLIGGAVAYAVFTQTIGLHLVIGAFLFGVAVPRGSALVERVSRQMQGFTHIVLLPLFFAGIGLKISGAALGTSGAAWLLFGAVLATAVIGKLVGGAGGARLAGLPGPDAWRVGALMNCRGVTELVVAAIGWQYHLINGLGLTMITLVALITTAATAPLLELANGRTIRPRQRASRTVPALSLDAPTGRPEAFATRFPPTFPAAAEPVAARRRSDSGVSR
jgi:Kef-type K+ transport system membrane component KefB